MTHHGHHHHHHHHNKTNVIVTPTIGYGIFSYWNSSPYYGSYRRTRGSFIVVILVILVFIIALVVPFVRKKLKHGKNNSPVPSDK